jgi:Icc-related predicted phosphoesterase
MPASSGKLRVAAIGDLHVMEDSVAPYRELFAEISGAADVLALCGDLTNFGKTGEAEILAEDIRTCSIPVVGVLGNHDYECGQPETVSAILREAGMTVLDEQATEIEGVGFAGVKGFMGGYGRGELAPFGEPIEIFQYLGSQRLADAIDRFDHVRAVVHGHAHHGRYEGKTPLGKPVYNVAQFVLKPLFGKPYTVIEV